MGTAAMGLGDIALRGAQLWHDRVAFRWEGRARTYGEMDERVARLVTVLSAAGVDRGTRLAALSINTPDVIEGCLAAAELGAVVVPLNVRLHPDEINFQVDDAGATHAFVHPSFEAVARDAGLLDRTTFVLGGELDERLRRVDRAERGRSTGSADDPCIQLYTSGTTGRPKGCLLSQRAWLASNANMAHGMAVTSDDRLLGVYPFFHVAGFGLALTHLTLGAEVVLPVAVDPDEIWGLTSEWSLTTIALPGMLGMLTHSAAEGARRGSVRGVIGGANMENPKVFDVLDHVVPGARFFGVYGSTEAGNFVTLSSADDERERRGTIGRPLFGFTTAILGPDDELLAPDEVGELGLRGASTMDGYWNLPEATADALSNGWLHTGDLMRRDGEGYLYFVDRDKDLIKPGGENVYSIEVENVLVQHPDVADVAVIGVRDGRWGEAVKAVVVVAPGTAPTAQAIDAFCLDRLSAYKRPRWYEFADEIPRSPLGKILKRDLRDTHDPSRAVRLAERDTAAQS